MKSAPAILIALFLCMLSCRRAAVEAPAPVGDTLPDTTNYVWGDNDNTRWVIDQITKDSFPDFDLSSYRLSPADQDSVMADLMEAWHDTSTWFEMSYISDHPDAWRYVWRVCHLPNDGLRGMVATDIIVRQYFKDNNPDMLDVYDRHGGWRDLYKFICDNFRQDSGYSNAEMGYDAATDVWWERYVQWVTINQMRESSPVDLEYDMALVDSIHHSVYQYQSHTASGGSGDWVRFYIWEHNLVDQYQYMLSLQNDSVVDHDVVLTSLSHVRHKLGMLSKDPAIINSDDVYWTNDKHFVDTLNFMIRQDAKAFLEASSQWYSNRIRTSKSLDVDQRRKYDVATLSFLDFLYTAERYLREDNGWDDDDIMAFGNSLFCD